MSNGFDRDRDRTQEELTDNENQKRNCPSRSLLRNVLCFVERQETATYDLGYNLTLTWNINNAILKKALGIDNAKIDISSID